MIAPQSVDSVLLLRQPEDAQWVSIVEAMKPGAHLLLFSNVKEHHAGTIAAEDAGLEIRDTIAYVFAEGENTSIKLVAMARKPLESTVAENVLKWGIGGLNIDKGRVTTQENLNGGAYSKTGNRKDLPGAKRSDAAAGMMAPGKTVGDEFKQPEGRWPANLILQDCPIVREMFPDAKSGSGNGNAAKGVPGNTVPLRRGNLVPRHDTGSAARFFHSTPSKGIFDGGLHHLCKYLVRLITPLGGKVLTLGGDFDPVNKAATDEGFTAAPLDYYLQGQEKFTF